ncbi:MAG: PA2169 family four-helix-bundle protein [Phycisphaeraceae bacterium]
MIKATPTGLSLETCRRLQALVQEDRASEADFRNVGDSLEDAELTALCYSLAHERRDFARELEQLIEQQGQVIDEAAGPAGRVQAWWRGMRTRLTWGERATLLQALERSEARTRGRYDAAIRDVPRWPVRELLHRHHRSIRETHRRLRTLRRRYAEHPV